MIDIPIDCEVFPAVRYYTSYFTVFITPLAAFLTASIMAMEQIHYNFTNTTFVVSQNIAYFLYFLGTK